MYLCIENKSNTIKKEIMAKKRKLNSNNPKYWTTEKTNEPVIKKKVLMCNVPIRNANKELVPGKTVPMYGVWYENDLN